MTIDAESERSFLATRRGRLTLTLLCTVAFLDIADAGIVTTALPSIRHDIPFSVQSLQWVSSGYLLSYGGLMLLGGRAADLLGRRRVLIAGTSLFACSSLTGGLADSEAVLIGARLAQGAGAAMMSPAALSILTTTFSDGRDRTTAVGAWGAMAGLGGTLGVVMSGLLAGGPGWRWVFFINLPACVFVLAAAPPLLSTEPWRPVRGAFDAAGAILVTAGLLLLVYVLVQAPTVGWGTARTIVELAVALGLLIAFVVNESRHPNPLVPLDVFRIPGVAAADATQLIAQAGFFSLFFFLTIYVQTILGYSPLQAGAAFASASVGVGVSAGIGIVIFPRIGTGPVIIAGAIVGAAGLVLLAQIPVDGTYLRNILPGLALFGLGLGALFVGVQTAGNAGVPPDIAGLAAALITASFQIGGALGLAIFSAIATSRTHALIAAHTPQPEALVAGFHRALLDGTALVIVGAIIASRTTNTRTNPITDTTAATAIPSDATYLGP